jgi:hypothetical protein
MEIICTYSKGTVFLCTYIKLVRVHICQSLLLKITLANTHNQLLVYKRHIW